MIVFRRDDDERFIEIKNVQEDQTNIFNTEELRNAINSGSRSLHFMGPSRSIDYNILRGTNTVNQITMQEAGNVGEDLNFIKDIPSLRYVRFGNRFNQDISFLRDLNNINILFFDENFDQDIDALENNYNLRKIYFGDKFNKSVRSLGTCENLEVVIFGNSFNPPDGIYGLAECRNIRILRLGKNFNNSNCSNIIRNFSELEILIMSCENLEISTGIDFLTNKTQLNKLKTWTHFNSSLMPLNDLINLEFLTLSGEFNQSLNPLIHHINIKILILGDKFNHPIEPIKNCKNIKILQIGNSFNETIECLDNKRNLTSLIIGNSFNQPIDYLSKNENLEIIMLGDSFNQSINSLLSLNKLTKIQFGKAFNQPLDALQNKINLKTLKVSGNFKHPLDPLIMLKDINFYIDDKYIYAYDIEKIIKYREYCDQLRQMIRSRNKRFLKQMILRHMILPINETMQQIYRIGLTSEDIQFLSSYSNTIDHNHQKKLCGTDVNEYINNHINDIARLNAEFAEYNASNTMNIWYPTYDEWEHDDYPFEYELEYTTKELYEILYNLTTISYNINSECLLYCFKDEINFRKENEGNEVIFREFIKAFDYFYYSREKFSKQILILETNETMSAYQTGKRTGKFLLPINTKWKIINVSSDISRIDREKGVESLVHLKYIRTLSHEESVNEYH